MFCTCDQWEQFLSAEHSAYVLWSNLESQCADQLLLCALQSELSDVRPLSGSWMFYPKLSKCSSIVWTVNHSNPLSILIY